MTQFENRVHFARIKYNHVIIDKKNNIYVKDEKNQWWILRDQTTRGNKEACFIPPYDNTYIIIIKEYKKEA